MSVHLPLHPLPPPPLPSPRRPIASGVRARVRASVLAIAAVAFACAAGAAPLAAETPAASSQAGVPAAAALAPGLAPDGAAPDADPEAIFARAKAAWRARADAPFVRYSLLERYTWRDRLHENWWQAAYRTRDRALALRRTVVADQEDARLRGASIGLNLRWHGAPAKADALDTNPDADAFPVLAPMIDPDASFGLLRHGDSGELSGDDVASAPQSAATAVAAIPLAGAAPADAAPAPLRELGRVEAIARDYRIAFAGVEQLRYGSAYHLTLEPLRDPKRYRLRDLWIATGTFATVRLAVDGLFAGKPYDDARWTVSYVPIDGRWYVGQVKTADTLRFGIDRFVDGVEFDFVQYAFPADVPDLTFERYAL